jgi:hypothetical protein
MLNIKKLFLILVIPLLSFVTIHKFYVSVTEVKYSEKDKSLQILLRIFIDDIEKTLEERYAVNTELATPKENKEVNKYLERYINDKLTIKINGVKSKLSFLGKEYDVDIMKCYVEIENVDYESLQQIEVSNEILFEQFEEQQNIIHFRLPDRVKSFLLVKGNYKGLLNF